MSDWSADLPGEEPEIIVLAERLQRDRPVPAPAFRGDLRRRLAGTRAGASRPKLLWGRVAALTGSGGALLVIAGLGAAGAGPLSM